MAQPEHTSMAAATPAARVATALGPALLGECVLLALLLLALLLPLWFWPFPPLYDYPAHLQAAQVVARYDDPRLAYAESYVLREGWQTRSNALFTLALLALAPLMPIPLAGKLLLSLTLVLFVGGLYRLLRQNGTLWPLLLLAPPLAYHFALTSGWINFALATALGLHVLGAAEHYRTHGPARSLLIVALLMLLIYCAHLVVWALLVLIVTALLAADPPPGRRTLWLLLALSWVAPLLVLTQPGLALVAALIGPMAWCGVTIIRRTKLRPQVLALATLALMTLAVLLYPLLENLLQGIDPDASYLPFYKATFPLRTVALPHQFMPPDRLIVAYNGALLLLLLPIVAILAWAVWRSPAPARRWLAPLALLALLYAWLPTASADIYFTEPRLLVFGTLLALAYLRLPDLGAARRVLAACALTLCLLSLAALHYYAWAYNRHAAQWVRALETLPPAQKVLVLSQQNAPGHGQYTIIRFFNHFYDGYYFSNMYALRHGGSVSANFGNGPIWFRPELPTALYFSREFADPTYAVRECTTTRMRYDAVLAWGPLEPALAQQLAACFGAGQRYGELTIYSST